MNSVYFESLFHWSCARAHTWQHVCIKQSLTVIGGGGGAAGVFVLAAIQHSTFLCDIQNCDLRKPALQRRACSFQLYSPATVSFHSPRLHIHLFPFKPSPFVFKTSGITCHYHSWSWFIFLLWLKSPNQAAFWLHLTPITVNSQHITSPGHTVHHSNADFNTCSLACAHISALILL